MNNYEMNSRFGPGDEERLWEYIDGIATPEEKTIIDQLLESSAEWREKYNDLFAIQQLLRASDLEEPSMRFTKSVMEEIGKLHIAPATKTYINKNIIRGLAIFFITMIVGFLVYGFGQIDWTVGTVGDDSTLPVDLTKLDYSKMFSNDWVNAFMMINVILGLFLFDRYLANKRKQFQEEA